MSAESKMSANNGSDGGVVVCPWNVAASPPSHPQDFADIVRQQQRQAKEDLRSNLITQAESVSALALREELELKEALSQSLQISNSFVDSPDSACFVGIDEVPEELLSFLEQDEEKNAECESDAAIAQMLQTQYDREYDDELERRQRTYNKDSKVTVSFDKLKRDSAQEAGEDEQDIEDPSTSTDWDRFETNKKILEAIPRCGYKVDKKGEWMTKHDPHLNGVRNVCRLMSFPLEFATGDGAGFDMKLSNKVFNQLKMYSSKHQRKTNKMQDRKENVATAEKGVDVRTRLLLYKLISNGLLDQINGVISTGKEALILHATIDPRQLSAANGGGGVDGTTASVAGGVLLASSLPTQLECCNCAMKVFKTTLNDFKQRDRYIKDDYRFKDRFNVRFSRQNNFIIINMWAEKEWHNLIRIKNAGIRCPSGLWLKNHILMMTMIGNDCIPAEKLKHANLTVPEWELVYEEMVNIMYRLYNQAKLVHADLNEYNILWHDGHCWLIDVAQAVEPQHPNALQFLMNDCRNIVNFFRRKEVSNTHSKEELFHFITGLDADNVDAAMLERLHTKGDDVLTGKEILTYPFDIAWEMTTESTAKLSANKAVKDNSKDKIHDTSVSDATVNCQRKH